jgi:hypothetical protein
MTIKEDSEPLSEQGLVVYRALHEQISFLKKQQWTITNYLLVVYAAAFGIVKGLDPTPLALRYLSIGIVFLTCLYGVAALIIVQCDLADARKRIISADGNIFGTKERADLGIQRDEDPYGRGLLLTLGLGLALVAGAVLVIAYLGAKQ